MALKRTPLQRKVALRRAGKKTHEWEQARAKLKVAFAAAEITRCEVQYLHCSGAMFLGFAHTKKRRNIFGPELFRCVLACTNCHQRAEALGEDAMRRELELIIAARETPVILDAKGC